MPRTAVIVKTSVRCTPNVAVNRRFLANRPVLVITACKESHTGFSIPENNRQSTAGTWFKTGLMAGVCLLVGFGSGAAHAGRKAPTAEPAAVVTVEQQAPANSGGSSTAVVAVDWQKVAKDVQASPYTLPVVAVVLLVAATGLLGGGKKKDADAASPTAATPAAPPAPTLPEPAPEPAPAPAVPVPTPVVVTARPMTVSANPNMALPSVPAWPVDPVSPPAPEPAPAVTAVPEESAPTPEGPAAAPAAVEDTRLPAKEWITSWRAGQPSAAEPEAAAAPVEASVTPAPEPVAKVAALNMLEPALHVNSRPSAKEWVASWRASQSNKAEPEPVAEAEPVAVAAAALPEPAAAAAVADPAPAPEPDNLPSAITAWRVAQPPKAPAAVPDEEPTPAATIAVVAPQEVSAEPQLTAAELLKLASGRPEILSTAAQTSSIMTDGQYVVFKFNGGSNSVTTQPISVLSPPADAVATTSDRSVYDSAGSSGDEDDVPPPPPPPSRPAATATVAAARVVQGPPPVLVASKPEPPPVAPPPATARASTAPVARSSSAPTAKASAFISPVSSVAPGARLGSKTAAAGASSISSSSSESLSAAARDPIVVTAAVVVGAARQMKGFGAFLSNGLVPAVGALLNGGKTANGR